MKKLFTFIAVICLALNASAQYQVGNSDFETDWTDTNEPGNGWYSFVSGTGTMSALGIPFSKGNTTKVDGRNGGTAVRLISSPIWGKNANGNLTTGRINLGSSTPSAQSNYNFTSRGTNNHCVFVGRPDKMEFWATFKRGGSDNNGRCHAIIHGDVDYKDPYETADNEANYKIAEVTVYATPCTEWTKFEGEFKYTGQEAEKSYLLATFTTNETPGGSSGDVFVIDDIKFIYYSELASATYNGNAISFNGTSATVNEYYDASKLNITSNGHGAKVETSMDESKQLLTVTIKGDNISEDATNYHTYTIQFKKYGYDLLSLAYNGVVITGYEQDGDALDVVLDEEFDINKLSYTLSEYAESTFDYDEETGFLAITVTSKNGNSAEYDFNIYRRGDINNDSQVSIADVTSLVNIILGKQPDYKVLVADVNGDKGVSIADVTALVNIILGKAN